jgi:hypothetical protein
MTILIPIYQTRGFLTPRPQIFCYIFGMAKDPWKSEAEFPRSLYDVLGVAAGASPRAIIHAYRQAARSWHPDARPEDPEATSRFRVLTGAYEVLSDPVRRADYDRARLTKKPQRCVSQWDRFAQGRSWPDQVGETHAFSRNSRDVFLDAPRPRSSQGDLWAGKVRVEAPHEGPMSLPQSPLVGHRFAVNALTSLLTNYLADGWWSA